MSSRSTTGILYQRVMEEAGFYRNGVPTSGVIEAESLRTDNQQLEKRIKYSAVIDPNQINATAVFELSGSPCIYFTQLDQSDPDPRELARLHKLSWNHGLAPMLWVVTPTNVRLYNCYSEPTEDNPERNLIALFEHTEASLRQLNEHASRLQIESGEFWQWQNARQIDRKKRVDRVLVEDLQKAEKKLRAQGLDSQAAHALLMQSIFVAYLQDRGILNTQFFRSRFNVDSFTDLLNDVSNTRKLFEWLQATFNGDMFPVSPKNSQDSYEVNHREIVKDLVNGTIDIETGQGRLWRFYDFKVIPVELISSIYENFLYSKNSKTAKELSVHYTPINLVDLVLDEVFRDDEFQKRLNSAVFNLYNLNEDERILVEDTVNLTIDLRMKREASIALEKPTLDELKLYGFQLIGVIQPFLQTLRERVLVADVIEVSKSPLQVVKFTFLPTPGREHIVQTTQAQELKEVLNRIAEQLPQKIADRIYTRRDLRIYAGQDIYIIKPAQKRYWSRSAGLNDADLIISEHLRVNRAAIG